MIVTEPMCAPFTTKRSNGTTATCNGTTCSAKIADVDPVAALEVDPHQRVRAIAATTIGMIAAGITMTIELTTYGSRLLVPLSTCR